MPRGIHQVRDSNTLHNSGSYCSSLPSQNTHFPALTPTSLTVLCNHLAIHLKPKTAPSQTEMRKKSPEDRKSENQVNCQFYHFHKVINKRERKEPRKDTFNRSDHLDDGDDTTTTNNDSLLCIRHYPNYFTNIASFNPSTT